MKRRKTTRRRVASSKIGLVRRVRKAVVGEGGTSGPDANAGAGDVGLNRRPQKTRERYRHGYTPDAIPFPEGLASDAAYAIF